MYKRQELNGLEERAKYSGASKLYIEDITDEFCEDYILPCVQAVSYTHLQNCLGRTEGIHYADGDQEYEFPRSGPGSFVYCNCTDDQCLYHRTCRTFWHGKGGLVRTETDRDGCRDCGRYIIPMGEAGLSFSNI